MRSFAHQQKISSSRSATASLNEAMSLKNDYLQLQWATTYSAQAVDDKLDIGAWSKQMRSVEP